MTNVNRNYKFHETRTFEFEDQNALPDFWLMSLRPHLPCFKMPGLKLSDEKAILYFNQYPELTVIIN